MNVQYGKIRIELGSKRVKPFYVFANCPNIILDEFISIVKDVLGKKTTVSFISSQKESIIEFFATGELFSGNKLVIVDLERISLSQKQINEILKLFSSFLPSNQVQPIPSHGYAEQVHPKNVNRILIIRSSSHPIPKDIQSISKQKGFFFWVLWTSEDIISILKGRFPDVRFMNDAEDVIRELLFARADVYEIVSKAVLIAYPRRYINRNDIIQVLPQELSQRFKDIILNILSGDLKTLPTIQRMKEDVSSLISFMAPYIISFVKIKSEGEAYGSVKKYHIMQTFRTQNVDRIIRSIRSSEIKDIVRNFLEVAEKDRLGLLPQDVYIMRFAFYIPGKERKI